MFKIIIDDNDNYDYDLRVISRPSIPVTNYSYNETTIANRGPLYNKTYVPDKTLTVDFNFIEEECFGHALRKMNAWFLNAKKIKFSDDIGVYYRVKKVSIDDIERQLKILGKFSVEFTIEPYAYSCDGDMPLIFSQSDFIVNSVTLHNFGTVECKPKFRLYGSGTITISINGKTVKVTNVTDFVDIDSELEYCFKNSTNMNKYMTGDYVSLEQGENVITVSSNVTQLEIVPRWRYL